MLAVLADADDGDVSARRACVVVVSARGTATGGQCQNHGQGQGSAEQFFQVFHVDLLLLI